MKANMNNLSIRNVIHDNIAPKKSGQYMFAKNKLKNTNEYNTIRPAQAVSFGGSAVSLAENAASKVSSETYSKVTEKIGSFIANNRPTNKLAAFVGDNEVAYNAIYSMIFAGIIKPICVLKQKGNKNEKDKQYIATKNFLQAFVGSFLTFTVGGGLIKKAYDVVSRNIKMFKVSEDATKLEVLSETSDKVKSLAADALVKENTKFKDKFKNAKADTSNAKGLDKFTQFFKTLFGEIEYKPTKDAIETKSKELVEIANKHKAIFDTQKAREFVRDLKLDELKDGVKSSTLGNRSALAEAYESVWKNSANWITTLSKAKIASWLLPAVTALLFAERLDKANKQKVESIAANPLLMSPKFNEDMKNFKSFKTNNNQPSFTGSVLDKGIDGFAKGLEKLSMSDFGQGATKAMAKVSKKPSPRMGDLESFILTGYWVGSTSLSKKIEPDQKLGLNVHTVLVTAVSSSLAFVMDMVLDPMIKWAQDAYKNQITNTAQEIINQSTQNKQINIEEAIKQGCSNLYGFKNITRNLVENGALKEGKDLENAIAKLTNTYGKRLSKFKSLTIFTMVVRFLVPVLMVNASGKIKEKIKNKKAEKDNSTQNA